MAISTQAALQANNSEPVALDPRRQSESQVRPVPQYSEIRELNAGELDATEPFELIGDRQRHHSTKPHSLALDDAFAQYSSLSQNDEEVLHAFRIGDLPQAAAMLLRENCQLRREIESDRANFEELRAVNIALQEQAAATLGVADDQRLELLDEFDRARSELLELEAQLEQARREYENDLQEIRRQRDELDFENGELKMQLVDCRSAT